MSSTPTAGRRSRLRALKVLFQADLRSQDPRDVLASLLADPDAAALLDDLDEQDDEATGDAPLGADGHTQRLVAGVAEHLRSLDTLIEELAVRWTVARMPLVDRNVLRLGTYELLHEDVPDAVVIDEAVEIVKSLSTDNSSRFVNGVLAGVRKRRPATPTA